MQSPFIITSREWTIANQKLPPSQIKWKTMQIRGTMHVHPSTCKVKQKYQELIKIKRTWKRMQAHAIPCRTQRNHKQTNKDKWNRPMRSAHISNRVSTCQGKTRQEQHPTLTPWWRDVESPCRNRAIPTPPCEETKTSMKRLFHQDSHVEAKEM
jgi:hypothetical protein